MAAPDRPVTQARGRPEVLWPLFAGLETLAGIGPRLATMMEGAGIGKPRDLLFTLPHSLIDRRPVRTIRDVEPPAIVTVEDTVGAHQQPRSRSAPVRITVTDAETTFQLVYFHARGDHLRRLLPTGARRLVSGKLELFDGIARSCHCR